MNVSGNEQNVNSSKLRYNLLKFGIKSDNVL